MPTFGWEKLDKKVKDNLFGRLKKKNLKSGNSELFDSLL